MNKMKYLLPVLFLFASFNNFGQVVKFERILGGEGYDQGNSVIQVFDKGYVVAGSTTSFGQGSNDMFLIKTDSLGIPVWQRTFGGINVDKAYALKETRDSGLVVAGYTNSFGHGGYDMFVIRTDRNGDTLWTKTYGGSNWDFAYSIDTTNDGGFIVAGGTYSYGKGDEDMYLVKLNAMGDTIWTKTFGDTLEDESKSVIQTSDGGYVLTGYTKSLGDTLGDIYTIKTLPNGDTTWTSIYRGIQTDVANQIIENYSGGYIIGGKTDTSGVGKFDDIIINLSSSGQPYAINVYGGSDNDGVNSIAQSRDGTLAILGYTYTYGHGLGTDDMFIYVFNPFNGFHSLTFGGIKMEVGNCINKTQDNGYIICGNSNSYSNLDHIYLIKTDSNGVASGTIINTPTSISSFGYSQSSFSIYPNPSNHMLYLDCPVIVGKEIYTITINDILGRECYKKRWVINDKSEINISDFPNGIYAINIISDKKNLTQKFIISH